MNARQGFILAGLAIAVLFLSSCRERQRGFGHGPGAGHGYGQQDQRVFEVYIYADSSNSGKCSADWPVGTLWKSKHHTVTWYSDDGAQYTVDFNRGTHADPKSPFHSATFTVPAGDKVSSGPLLQNATGYYDFAILDANGNPCKDPSDPGYYIKP